MFKWVLVGEVGVGKSSLVLRYTEDVYVGESVETIGADFKVKYATVDKKRLKIQIWDTAGQEKFRVMTSSYFVGARGVIVVYDITDRNSFVAVEKWLKEAKALSNVTPNSPPSPMHFIIVGNKTDLAQKRQVTEEELKQLAEKYKAKYCETSAKERQGVVASFDMLCASSLLEPGDQETSSADI
uniref:Uncharacterized protein n=1 Tax=Arcella intermedia TaxID=1963864 RepID=A0A6B2LK11_9EUKA